MKLRLVRARQGALWVRNGFRIFFRRPMAFAVLFADPRKVMCPRPVALVPTDPPPDPAGTLTFTAENDLFGGSTDRYYSNGVLLTFSGLELL